MNKKVTCFGFSDEAGPAPIQRRTLRIFWSRPVA